jgi:DNA-binding transcriptional ArsR family regulator
MDMDDLSQYYTLLRDPARRKIIEILGSRDKIGFKELRLELGLGVGTVYYHLDMLSEFIMQDRQHKYKLNDRGVMLYNVLKEGSIPASLEISGSFNLRMTKWLFLSPLFSKTVKPLRLLPLAVAILFIGGFGTVIAQLDPALFFYFPYSPASQTSAFTLYIFEWIGLFLFSETATYVLYRRVGNDLQLFTCLGLSAFPTSIFPYVYLVISGMTIQWILIVLQIWSLLLVSAALCFGKGIRLDKAIVISLTAMYINIAVLLAMGRFP